MMSGPLLSGDTVARREHYIVLGTRYPEKTYGRMAPFSPDEVKRILSTLKRAGVDPRLVGSWGIVKKAKIGDYWPHDLDILVPPGDLETAAEALRSVGFRKAAPWEMGQLYATKLGEGGLYIIPRTVGPVNLLRERGGTQVIELIPNKPVSIYTGISRVLRGVKESPKTWKRKDFEIHVLPQRETGLLVENVFPGTKNMDAAATTVHYKLLRLARRDLRLLLLVAEKRPDLLARWLRTLMGIPPVNPLQLYFNVGWLANILKKRQAPKQVVSAADALKVHLVRLLKSMGVDARRKVCAGSYCVPLSKGGRILTQYVRLGLNPKHGGLVMRLT